VFHVVSADRPRRHYACTDRVTSPDGEIDYIAVERCLNGEAVENLTEAEKRRAAELLHERGTPVAVIVRRVHAGEARVKAWLGLPARAGACAGTRGAAAGRH
jgi:hypothetical protein